MTLLHTTLFPRYNISGKQPIARIGNNSSPVQSDLHVETRDLHVGASGEFGYATGLQMISGTLKHGQKSGMWIRFTSLYRKVNGKWLDFHDHVSVPVDIQSGKALLDMKP